MPAAPARSTLPALLVSIVLVGLGALFGFAFARRAAPPVSTAPDNQNTAPSAAAPVAAAQLDSGTFDFDGRAVTLVGGQATVDAAEGNGVTETYLRLASMSAGGDLNGDGLADAAGLVLYNSSGTGVFAYVVALLSGADGSSAVQSVALGDRLLFDGMSIADGVLTVAYQDRAADEAMVAIPTVPKVRRFRVVSRDGSWHFSAEPTQSACSGQNLSVQSPTTNATVSFPMVVTAIVDNSQNTGCLWTVFEAQAGVVELKNAIGTVLDSALLVTTMDWMTISPVTYTATLQPSPLPASGAMLLVITEENPSGQGTPEVVTVPVGY